MQDHHHLLIVDDQADVTSLFELYFESIGYRVTVAHDGVAALQTDEADPADLLITDFMMPRMNGRDLAARLQQRRPGLPVIVVSGYAGIEKFDGPCLRVLAKPVSLPVLGRCIEEMLGEARGAQRA